MGNKYTVHGGHAPHGKLGAGAVGYCSESLVDRTIKNSVISWLKTAGHMAVDCTYESAGTQSMVLTQIKKKINAEQNVTANISIHLNASKKSAKDNKVKGCECWVYTGDKAATTMASRICASLSLLGFTNRGVKNTTSLAVLKGIKNGGVNVLVEVFFCDDEDDYILYNKLGVAKVGKAIAEGITGHTIVEQTKTTVNKNYIYDGVNYGLVFNPDYYAAHNSDVVHALGNTPSKLFEHFLAFGMKEARQASTDFNVRVYKERYLDLQKAFGQDWPAYYKHYCIHGYTEGRKGI